MSVGPGPTFSGNLVEGAGSVALPVNPNCGVNILLSDGGIALCASSSPAYRAANPPPPLTSESRWRPSSSSGMAGPQLMACPATTVSSVQYSAT